MAEVEALPSCDSNLEPEARCECNGECQCDGNLDNCGNYDIYVQTHVFPSSALRGRGLKL
jgi:hypothetical protein